MAANAGQPFNQEGCVMELLTSLESGFVVVFGVLIYRVATVETKIGSLMSETTDLRSRVKDLERKLEDVDYD